MDKENLVGLYVTFGEDLEGNECAIVEENIEDPTEKEIVIEYLDEQDICYGYSDELFKCSGCGKIQTRKTVGSQNFIIDVDDSIYGFACKCGCEIFWEQVEQNESDYIYSNISNTISIGNSVQKLKTFPDECVKNDKYNLKKVGVFTRTLHLSRDVNIELSENKKYITSISDADPFSVEVSVFEISKKEGEYDVK
jgi:hypothetical protein